MGWEGALNIYREWFPLMVISVALGIFVWIIRLHHAQNKRDKADRAYRLNDPDYDEYELYRDVRIGRQLGRFRVAHDIGRKDRRRDKALHRHMQQWRKKHP